MQPKNSGIVSGSMLIFCAGNFRCAVPVKDVENVIRMVEITDDSSLTEMERGVAGSFSFHGNAVTVYSPDVFFGESLPEPKLTDKLIIANPAAGSCAFWVESIDRVCGSDELFGTGGNADKYGLSSEDRSEDDGGPKIPAKKLVSGLPGLEIYAEISGTEQAEISGTKRPVESGIIAGYPSDKIVLVISDINEFIAQGLKGSYRHISGYIRKRAESKDSEISVRSVLSDNISHLSKEENISRKTATGWITSGSPIYHGYEYPDFEKIKEILKERREQIGMPEEEAEDSEKIEILRFRLMYTEYAVEMKYIREVLINEKITPIPGIPDFIMGIFALRGEIISLVNLRVLFRLPKAGITDLNRVIILSNEELTFGILADYITDIGSIPVNQLKVPDEKTSPIDIKYIRGIAKDSLIVLDAKVLLSDPDMIIDEN
jgi:chemotaxis signal transduction protein